MLTRDLFAVANLVNNNKIYCIPQLCNSGRRLKKQPNFVGRLASQRSGIKADLSQQLAVAVGNRLPYVWQSKVPVRAVAALVNGTSSCRVVRGQRRDQTDQQQQQVGDTAERVPYILETLFDSSATAARSKTRSSVSDEPIPRHVIYPTGADTDTDTDTDTDYRPLFFGVRKYTCALSRSFPALLQCLFVCLIGV